MLAEAGIRWHTKPPRGTRVDPRHPIAHGLIGAWWFNEGDGHIIADVSGYGNHLVGSKTSGGALWVAGRYGAALNITDSTSFTCSALAYRSLLANPPLLSVVFFGSLNPSNPNTTNGVLCFHDGTGSAIQGGIAQGHNSPIRWVFISAAGSGRSTTLSSSYGGAPVMVTGMYDPVANLIWGRLDNGPLTSASGGSGSSGYPGANQWISSGWTFGLNVLGAYNNLSGISFVYDCCYLFNRLLTLPELDALLADPFVMAQQPNRLYVIPPVPHVATVVTHATVALTPLSRVSAALPAFARSGVAASATQQQVAILRAFGAIAIAGGVPHLARIIAHALVVATAGAAPTTARLTGAGALTGAASSGVAAQLRALAVLAASGGIPHTVAIIAHAPLSAVAGQDGGAAAARGHATLSAVGAPAPHTAAVRATAGVAGIGRDPAHAAVYAAARVVGAVTMPMGAAPLAGVATVTATRSVVYLVRAAAVLAARPAPITGAAQITARSMVVLSGATATMHAAAALLAVPSVVNGAALVAHATVIAPAFAQAPLATLAGVGDLRAVVTAQPAALAAYARLDADPAYAVAAPLSMIGAAALVGNGRLVPIQFLGPWAGRGRRLDVGTVGGAVAATGAQGGTTIAVSTIGGVAIGLPAEME